MHYGELPQAQGLYDPQHEKDACGVGFVVHLRGRKSHDIVQKGLRLLCNLEHRGASGSESNTGDGAGILIQMPDSFFRARQAELGFTLPPAGDYGAGLIFLPRDPDERAAVKDVIARIVAEQGQTLLGWRTRADRRLGARRCVRARSSRSSSRLFIGKVDRGARPRIGGSGASAFERALYVIRKRLEKAVDALDPVRARRSSTSSASRRAR